MLLAIRNKVVVMTAVVALSFVGILGLALLGIGSGGEYGMMGEKWASNSWIGGMALASSLVATYTDYTSVVSDAVTNMTPALVSLLGVIIVLAAGLFLFRAAWRLVRSMVGGR